MSAGCHYRTSPDVVIEKLGEAMIAVQLGTDRILELNETAARLVELLLAGSSDAEATSVLAGEYGVEAGVVASDVTETIGMLLAEQVLEPIAEATGGPMAEATGGPIAEPVP